MAGTHEPVAVLGIGAMGHGMAASALRAGIPVIVWNREREATRDLAELGAQVAETAADAARRAAIVVTMVTDADAVLSVARDQGMLAALAPGAIWVQMSTIGVAGIDQIAALAGSERPDVMLLDAPVAGSRDPAEHGQLTIFASGPGEARPRVGGFFDAIGQRTIWVGAAGAGTRLKLVNNTWLAFAAEAVAASVALGRRLAGGQAAADRPRRVLGPVRALARAQGRPPRPAGGRRRPVRRPGLPGRRMAAGRRPRSGRAGRDRGDSRARTAGRNAMTARRSSRRAWPR
jgi:3-hydroxyisobutyrate dehydrogenase